MLATGPPYRQSTHASNKDYSFGLANLPLSHNVLDLSGNADAVTYTLSQVVALFLRSSTLCMNTGKYSHSYIRC
jgi:hypothetical protein